MLIGYPARTGERLALEGFPEKAPFVGREREFRLLHGLVCSIGGGGSSAVIIGEAGIGKTALLERVAMESPSRICRVRGVQSELAIPFAAAADLLLPFRELFDRLPAAQHRALAAALALDHGPADGPLAVFAGALGVLAAAAEQQPLLILVDDVDAVDEESRRLLAFVARRLAAERVAIIFAARDLPGTRPAVRELPTLALTGLSLDECRELARRVGADVTRPILDRIARDTGGNPLAFLHTLARERLHEPVPHEPPVALGPSVQRSWLEVLGRLPEPTLRALFVVAAATAPDGPAVPDVLAELGLRLDDLEPAERCGLLGAAGPLGQLGLHHPLLRQVLVGSTPIGVRSATYRALAALARPDLQAWYLSLAAVGPDEEIAAALERAAAQARLRGGAAAIRLARRSAELSTDPAAAARRLLSAAGDALASGDPGSAVRWCRQAFRLFPPAATEGPAVLVLAAAMSWTGRFDESHDVLIRTAARVAARDPAAGAELLAEAALHALLAADGGRAADAAGASERLLGPGVRSTMRTRILVGWVHALRGAVHAGRSHLEPLGADDESDARQAPGGHAAAGHERPGGAGHPDDSAAHLGRALVWVERFDLGRATTNRAVEAARRAGCTGTLATALLARAELELWTGPWTLGHADAREALDWAEQLDQAWLVGHSLVLLARFEAARGEPGECERRIERCRADAGAALGWLAGQLPAAAGLAALTCGDPESAIEHLEAALAAGQAAGIANPVAFPVAGDLAEAYLRAGQADPARRLMQQLEECAATTGLTYPAVAAARIRGLMATAEDGARAAFASACARAQLRSMPFEQGRTLLCAGEVLRRMRRPMAARIPLREAEALFAGLGAPAWVRRARAELAAAGVRPPVRHVSASTLDELTPQEFQIARLVAAGQNNLEVAAALFLSRKTVEAHLTRVYRKVDVRSRTELAGVLLAQDGPAPASHTG